jgi:hypothetical protein
LKKEKKKGDRKGRKEGRKELGTLFFAGCQ